MGHNSTVKQSMQINEIVEKLGLMVFVGEDN